MRRTLSLVFVVFLAIPCSATAARPDAGLQAPSAVSLSNPLNALWDWLSAALPWLAGVAEPSPAAAKDLPPPLDPGLLPLSGTCIDPDGVRVPCAPEI